MCGESQRSAGTKNHSASSLDVWALGKIIHSHKTKIAVKRVNSRITAGNGKLCSLIIVAVD